MTPTLAPDGWQIERDATTKAAYAALATDRRWNGYSIADLAPPARQWTRVALARREDGAIAACLFYAHPQFNSTIPHGDPDGLAAILAAAAQEGDLPERTYILAQHIHLPALEAHYAFPDGRQEMIRMAVDRATFVKPKGGPPTVRLGSADLPALQALYAEYDAGVFTADQLANGVFHGVYEDGALVAAGGTHVVAPSYTIAAIGNIYVTPAARGRGLGAAVTAAVAAELLPGPRSQAILNVAATNAAAIRVYRGLGFAEHCPYVEALVVRR